MTCVAKGAAQSVAALSDYRAHSVAEGSKTTVLCASKYFETKMCIPKTAELLARDYCYSAIEQY